MDGIPICIHDVPYMYTTTVIRIFYFMTIDCVLSVKKCVHQWSSANDDDVMYNGPVGGHDKLCYLCCVADGLFHRPISRLSPVVCNIQL
jgi:hypothetical protein